VGKPYPAENNKLFSDCAYQSFDVLPRCDYHSFDIFLLHISQAKTPQAVKIFGFTI
jgi:hypothetical protein